jgi:glucose-6-phosphate isomerase
MNKTNTWQALQQHKVSLGTRHLKEMFENDPQRFKKFSLTNRGITLDYSKNRTTDTTMQLLFELAEESRLQSKIAEMFAGKKINTTENREVLHTALRQQHEAPIMVSDEDITPQIKQTLAKMAQFCEDVHSGKMVGANGKAFTDILCLGIGGSFLGPKIVVQALKQYRRKEPKVHFVANVDGCHLYDVLGELSVDTTLVVVASKSFSTQETMLNATTTRSWLFEGGLARNQVEQHMVAISSNVELAMEFGIHSDNIFPMWDWVGGRYSLWSAIGLPIALAIGFDKFEELLQGAAQMDEHFKNAPLSQNMPVIMALLGVWNINFWQATSHCIIPYCHYLRGLPAHIQQLDMESNGKSVSIDGEPLSYLTGPAIWGSEGVNSQHAFFQQIHQSNCLYPVDFILPLKVHHPYQEHHDMLVSHCFAQSQALMEGKTLAQARQELLDSGMNQSQSERLAPHKSMLGNKPNNVLLLDDLSPKNIGALLALYEHKVVVQGLLWNINSFDQWGVELGKQLSPPVYNCIQNSGVAENLDCSTIALIRKYVDS